MTEPVRTKRIYEPAAPDDGARVLIMRLWPRGIRKDRITVWLKERDDPSPLLGFLARATWESTCPLLACIGGRRAASAPRSVTSRGTGASPCCGLRGETHAIAR